MLLDLAITPDVFTEAGYSSSDRCPDCLRQLRPILIEEAVIRDLRDGEWRAHISRPETPCHQAGRELFEALIKEGRLRPIAPALQATPEEPVEWCWEALAAHERKHSADPLDGILAGFETAAEADRSGLVCAAERVHEALWWQRRSSSVSLHRCTGDYLKHLDRILRISRSIMFIDPHVDPTRDGYREFHHLLEAARARDPKPHFEIHRSLGFEGSGANRRRLTEADIRQMFEPLHEQLRMAALTAEIHVWDRLHDRFLIANLLGLSVPNGFDISSDGQELTRWTRLSSKDRDDVQREFDPASYRHQLCFKFAIGV